MEKVVISLLGLSVKADSKPLYRNNTDVELQDGYFINSIDVLLHSFSDNKFIFFGTKEAIDQHKKVFNDLIANKKVEFVEFDDKNLNDIFYRIITIIQENKDSHILFDITHSFRDSVIMSVLSTIISQIVYSPHIKMIYAKEIKRFQEYQYELVSEEILNTSNIAFILSSFISTLRIPSLSSKYELYEILHNFSNHLLSNQFNEIFKEDIGILKDYIQRNRENLFFVSNLLQEMEQMIQAIESIRDKALYEQFLFFSNFFLEKDYFLHSSSYLIEAIGLYIGHVLTELKIIDFDYTLYANQQKIKGLLNLQPSNNDFTFPNEYFVDINVKIIDEFYYLRNEVADIRNNLAHINVNQQYKDIKDRLSNAIKTFENLIEAEVLYKLDTTDKNKQYTVTYQLQAIQKEVKKFKYPKATSVPKIQTIFERYEKGEIDKLQSLMDIKKLKNYINKNRDRIKALLDKQKNRELILKNL